MKIFLGIIVNCVAIIIGSTVGLLTKKKINNNLNNTLLSVVGIVVLALGIKDILASKEIILVLISLVGGALIGEVLKLDSFLSKLTHKFIKNGDNLFYEGLLTSTAIFCIGAMTILGAIQSGTGRGHSILYTKSIIDGVTASILTSTFGIGVVFASIPTFIYTSIFIGGASLLGNIFTNDLLAEFSAVGGVILVALALSNLLKIKEIKVINLLPSLLIIIILFMAFK